MAESIRNKVSVLLLGIVVLSVLTLCMSHTEKAEAAFQYNSSESAYLQKLNPILTELSQLGSKVSKTTIGLQSAPEETCSNEFGFYQGIVVSLRNRLNSITPPPAQDQNHTYKIVGRTKRLSNRT